MVVRDDDDAGLDRSAVDRDPECARPPQQDPERPQPGEGLSAAATQLAAVHEPRVDAQRDVVEEEPAVRAPDVDTLLGRVVEGCERGERIVAVEAEVSGEVVASSERDDDEGQVALDCDLGDRRQGAVPARDAERTLGRRSRDLRGIVVRPEEMRLDAPALRLVAQLIRLHPPPRMRVDDEEAAHRVSIAYGKRSRPAKSAWPPTASQAMPQRERSRCGADRET